ncbi:hypothetical protein N7G274_008629 [Stereocaulon virgatum]|uniref:Uncharacterized protein n=1 Tax=Stereocaulon virgatum TaxID=373712 RepID=A0ABR4A0R9_9LECA
MCNVCCFLLQKSLRSPTGNHNLLYHYPSRKHSRQFPSRFCNAGFAQLLSRQQCPPISKPAQLLDSFRPANFTLPENSRTFPNCLRPNDALFPKNVAFIYP